MSPPPTPPFILTIFGASGDLAKIKIFPALYAGFWIMYTQGFSLLAQASEEYGWELNLAEVARIWQGGCIIRAELLKEIEDPLPKAEFAALRWAVIVASAHGGPIPVFGSALSYIDGLTQKNGPANLIQGLRDYFGAHTVERIDRPGHFHVQWKG